MALNIFYVYMYMDQDNVPFYIGKGRDYKIGFKRWRPQNRTKGNTMTARKVRKLGVENVKVYFLHKDISEEEAFQKEIYWIKYLGRRDNGTGQLTNHTDGGEGSGGHISPLKGVPRSKETRQKISKSNMGRVAWNKELPAWNKGVSQTKEAKQKQSDSMKLRWRQKHNVK